MKIQIFGTIEFVDLVISRQQYKNTLTFGHFVALLNLHRAYVGAEI